MPIYEVPGKTPDERQAFSLLAPSVNGATTLRKVLRRSFGDTAPSIVGLAEAFQDQITAVKGGSLVRAEALLLVQAHLLDALFNDLVRLTYGNTNNLDVFERLFRLAMKAQSQSRATVETMAAVKNPPVLFARQANVTSGSQQINNGIARGDSETAPNKLLEQQSGSKWLDNGAPTESSNVDTSLASLAAVNGAENGGG